MRDPHDPEYDPNEPVQRVPLLRDKSWVCCAVCAAVALAVVLALALAAGLLTGPRS